MFPDTITVEIEQDMLDRCVPNDCYQCPIALGVLALFPHGVTVMAEERTVLIDSHVEDFFAMYELTEDARHYMEIVDENGVKFLKPASFVLNRTFPK